MDISNITANSPQTRAAQTSTRANNTTLGKNGFLQLLVAQMKNQNPTNPMDGTKFAAQLAQFNSVEQLINVNAGIEGLAKSQRQMSRGLSNTIAATLTGKKVLANSDRVHIKAGKEQTIPFKLSSTARDINVKITDSAGNTIRTTKLKNLGAGKHTWRWDGRSDSGDSVPEGTYSVQIDAKNGDDNVKALIYQQGVAEKVRYTQDGVKLIVNGVAIPLGNVEEIGV